MEDKDIKRPPLTVRNILRDEFLPSFKELRLLLLASISSSSSAFFGTIFSWFLKKQENHLSGIRRRKTANGSEKTPIPMQTKNCHHDNLIVWKIVPPY